MNTVRVSVWSIAAPALFAALQSFAVAEPQFDETKRVVLPSEAATTILKWYVADNSWTTEDWPVSSGELEHLELTLATALTKAHFGSGRPKLPNVTANICRRGGRIFAS